MYTGTVEVCKHMVSIREGNLGRIIPSLVKISHNLAANSYNERREQTEVY